MNQVIIGLSGHIDHGKTSLIKSLTGVNTDKMIEEMQRGMTIDIGFAFLNDHITIIDVPGHEKFLKNMMTGVSSIDVSLLVVAADDGVMPQTREHLDILSLLDIKYGCIVINKIDLVDQEWLELVKSDIDDLVKNTFLKNAPVLEVSTIKNQNIDLLKKELINIAQNVPDRYDSDIFRMHIDRVFIKKGFGTVVTGTVISGQLLVGQEIEIMPESIKGRVRNIQSHDQLVPKVVLGDRAAINIQGIDKKNIGRGSQIVEKDFFIETNQIAAIIELLDNDNNILKHNQRIRIHVGTQEVIARIFLIDQKEVKPNGKNICLIKLESFITVAMHDKFILRTFSPMITIGGGIVVDNELKGRWKSIKYYLKDIYNGDDDIILDKMIEHFSSNPMTLNQAKIKFGISIELLRENIKNYKNISIIKYKSDDWIITRYQMDEIIKLILNSLKEFHQKNPYLKGMNKEEIRQILKSNENFADYILNEISRINLISKDENYWSLKDHEITLSDKMQNKLNVFQSHLEEQKFITLSSVNSLSNLNINENEFKTILDISINTDLIIKIESNIIFTMKTFLDIKQSIINHFLKTDTMSITDFKNIVNTSRKYAVPLLEYFDKIKITYRDGNNRKLVK